MTVLLSPAIARYIAMGGDLPIHAIDPRPEGQRVLDVAAVKYVTMGWDPPNNQSPFESPPAPCPFHQGDPNHLGTLPGDPHPCEQCRLNVEYDLRVASTFEVLAPIVLAD